MEKSLRKEIFARFWAIRPEPPDDEMIAGSYFDNIITSETEKLPDGSPVTGEFLIKQYQIYIDYMSQFDHGKYTKKEYTPENPADWLSSKGWKRKIVAKADPLDFYLYGIE